MDILFMQLGQFSLIEWIGIGLLLGIVKAAFNSIK
jgi:hypothetical protein